jgi:hypothetical protein
MTTNAKYAGKILGKPDRNLSVSYQNFEIRTYSVGAHREGKMITM